MNLTHVLRHGSDVHNRLLTEARETHNPVVTVQRIEEAAALEHLLRIARLHLQPAPAPDIAEAMGGLGEILQSIFTVSAAVDHAARLGTAIQDALSRTHGKKGVPALPAVPEETPLHRTQERAVNGATTRGKS